LAAFVLRGGGSVKQGKNFINDLVERIKVQKKLLDLYRMGTFSTVWSNPRRAWLIQNPKRAN
jgi:hypothetical protein